MIRVATGRTSAEKKLDGIQVKIGMQENTVAASLNQYPGVSVRQLLVPFPFRRS